MGSPTVAALSRRPKYISDSEGIADNQKSRLDYLASPELVDILTRFMLGGRLPSQVEEGTIHPMDPTADRTTYISEQPPPRDLLGSAMERGNPLAWMEQVQEPEGTPPPSLVETLARKVPQLAEQVAIMAGAAKGVGGARGTPRMQWEPRFGAEAPRVAPSESRKPYSSAPDSLMGFPKDRPTKEYGAQKYKFELPVVVDFKDGTPVHTDIVKGLNEVHAMERARRNWPGAEVRKAEPGEVSSTGEPASPRAPVEPSQSMSTDILESIMDVNRLQNEKYPGQLDEMIKSISEEGIKSPVVVGYDKRTGKVMLSEGNTRLAAAKALGIKDIPVRFEPMVLEGETSPGGTPLRSIQIRKDAKGFTQHPTPEQIMSDLGMKAPVEPNPELVSALAGKSGGDTIRVYSGGTSAPSDFWSENPGRAASFGPNVWVVEIPRSVFEAGKAQAAKLGQPTKWDTVLPNEWVKKSSQVPSENLGR